MASTPVDESSAHLQLTQQLPVLPAATTSRVVVNNPLLRVIQFTFDTGELLTEHTSPRAVTCLLNEGRMGFTVDGVEHDMQAGDVIYLAPNAPHALVAKEPSRLTLTMVDVEAAPTVAEDLS